MERDRIIIVIITLVTYFFFMLVFSVLILNGGSSPWNSLTNSEKQDKSISSSITQSAISTDLNSRINFGVDPTPNPPLPPNIQDKIEIMD